MSGRKISPVVAGEGPAGRREIDEILVPGVPGMDGDHRIRQGFSTRRGGLPAGESPRFPSAWLDALGIPQAFPRVRLRQVHGDVVHTVTGSGPTTRPLPRADGCVTAIAGVVLVVATADCVPILLADRRAGVIGAAHMGWRGALAGIVDATVLAMAGLGAKPSRLTAAVGPAIGRCCFEVGAEVAGPFSGLAETLVDRTGHHPHVDLPAAAAHLLRRAGLAADAIHDTGICTHCHADRFWSHRAPGPRCGRLLSGIARLP
ncbi:MAG: peptidoglycan editing factor PgeF [Acidobacteriota bacterium]